jgi:hypothetical protein
LLVAVLVVDLDEGSILVAGTARNPAPHRRLPRATSTSGSFSPIGVSGRYIVATA